MATEVERKVLGVGADLVGVGVAGTLLLERLQRGVGAGNVTCVVLGVVQLHNFCGDVGLQSVVCVVEFGESVDVSHVDCPFLLTWPPS